MPRVTPWSCHVSLYGPVHVSLYGPATSASVQTVRTAQSAIFFACLTFRTERDIFSIRSPFDKVNIPPESGRRDGRNGIGFVAFRALSFLSIFQALSGFWIRFRIKTGSTNRIVDCLSRPPVIALTTVLDSYGHETYGWPQLYETDPDFSTTYQMLGENVVVDNFHL
jgi:hypothetical protein